jgi:hypothetical protein
LAFSDALEKRWNSEIVNRQSNVNQNQAPVSGSGGFGAPRRGPIPLSASVFPMKPTEPHQQNRYDHNANQYEKEAERFQQKGREVNDITTGAGANS